MGFPVKDWRDYPDRTTPIDAAALEDMEARLGGYVDTELAVVSEAPLNVQDPQFGALGDGSTDDSAAFAAIVDAYPEGVDVFVPRGDYVVNDGIVVGPNQPIRLLGAGMNMGQASSIGPTRIKRTEGTATMLAVAGTGQTSAGRGLVALENIDFDGGNLAGKVLDLQRTNNVELNRLRVGNCQGATALLLREFWNGGGSRVWIHDAGSGASIPAMLIDGASVASGGAQTAHFHQFEFESNYGTDLKLTGDAATPNIDGSQAYDVKFFGAKFEGGRAAAAACPYIDLDYAAAAMFFGAHINMHGDSDRTVPAIQQATGANGKDTGVLNGFYGLTIDVTQSTVPTYLLRVAKGGFVLVGADFPSASHLPGTAYIRIEAVVTAAKIAWDTVRRAAGVSTALVSDARTVTALPFASTLTLYEQYDVIPVGPSGSGPITAIAASRPRRTVTLVFKGSVTVNTGAALLLDGGVNFSATANDTLTVATEDGTNWFEVGRSVLP